MPHYKQHITDLAVICRKRQINHVVISPGSRSAPLIQAFYSIFGENCISIVDERSAAHFALGISIQTGIPAILICTSGTAVLNYAPALAEAYYQHVPLIAITADRPHEWIDQQDNQTLRQPDIYQNFVKASFELPQYIATADDLWYSHRIVNDALNICTGPLQGPVHINVPLTEPLYDELPAPSANIRIVKHENVTVSLKLPDELVNEWNSADRIMILHGQDAPQSELAAPIKSLMNDPRVVVIAENISNLADAGIISNSNILLSVSRGKSPDYPSLILHSGGQIVSKALTGYLRRSAHVNCWRIGNESELIDTFMLATRAIPYPAEVVYKALSKIPVSSSGNYRASWMKIRDNALKLAEKRIAALPFSDVRAFQKIMALVPDSANLVLGNSSVIRYSQLFPVNTKINYYSNRGISGIDGSLSTAAGIAFASTELTIAVVGDLGFVYDSNALWNKELPSRLRIVVINNQGGGIFHIIKGPSEHPGFKKFVEAHHPVNIAKLAEAYGLKYLFAPDEKSLADQWRIFTGKQKTAVVLEIKTDPVSSAASFRNLMAGPS